ncbi:MAG: helix-turn-helix domain-containing protein [Phenylobacterium sp.]
MGERRDEGCRAAVGGRLKALRLGRGLTQVKLAEPLGLTFQQINKYESGVSDLSVSRLLGLARVLDIPPSLLLEAPPAGQEELRPVNRLGSFRRDRGLQRSVLASAAGMSDQHLASLEAGTAELTVNWLIRLSNILGCHPWELVDPTYVNRPRVKPGYVRPRGRRGRLPRS